MARKTNKTDHVLSLLSGTDAAVEKEESKAGPQEDKEPDKGGSSPAAHSGNVHVVLAAAKEGDPVADIIKEKLEEELAEEEDSGLAGRMDPGQQEKTSVSSIAGISADGEEAAGREPGTTDTAVPDAEEETAAILSETEPEEPDEMEGYIFYNIMEKIVQEKAVKYMKQFGNCTCRRCEADTIALALSKLPPKYVVVMADSISPLLNFYEDHYAGQIIVEITKACIVVNKNPRHHRD